MSVEPGQPSGGPADGPSGTGRRFSAVTGSLAAGTPGGQSSQDDPGGLGDLGDQEDPGSRGGQEDPGGQEAPVARPTFTARPGGAPAPGTPAASPAPSGGEPTRPVFRRAAAAADEPLLSDADRYRARWQRVQASFVDDPSQAVGDAADLIEQTAQALIGALRQRQRELRVMWESSPDSGAGDGEAAERSPDTEHLRLMMQRYRALFNQLCRP